VGHKKSNWQPAISQKPTVIIFEVCLPICSRQEN
jgi:hypothetical protein